MQFSTTLPTLRAGNITLSPLTITDIEPLFRLVMKNRMHLRTWLNWVDQNNSIEQTTNFVQKALAKHNSHTGLDYTIWVQNTMIGIISYNYIDEMNKKAQIGYWIDEEHQGKGYMTNACRELVGFGLKTMQLHRIEITITVGNERSSAIAKKLGFKKEATLKESEWLGNHFTDQEIYRLLVDEWNF